MQIGDTIKDKRAFLRDGKAALNEIAGTDNAEAAQVKKPGKPVETLTELKIEGDTAIGVAVKRDDKRGGTEVYFRRENGSWVMATGAPEPDWNQPIQGFRFIDLLNEKK